MFEVVVSAPSVGSNYAARFHGFLNGGVQTCARSVPYSSKSNSSDAFAVHLCRYEHQCLALGSTPAFSRFFSTDVGFIHFHHTRKPISSSSDHGPAQLMQPCPRRLIATKPQYPLKSLRTGTVFLAGHPPDRPKPHRERRARSRKYRPRLDRQLVLAPRTGRQTPLRSPGFRTATAWTHKPIGPAQLKNVTSTGLFCRKVALQLCQGFRVLFHIPAYYMLGLLEPRGYPYKEKVFALLKVLPQATLATDDEVLFFIERHARMGRGMG